MRGIYAFLFLIAFASMAQAQLSGRWAMAVNSFSNVTTVDDSTYTADVSFASDQTGNGYLANQIQVGYRFLGSNKEQFRVSVVNSSSFSTANVTVVELPGTNSGPNGTGIAYAYDGSTELIPLLPVNSSGISSALAANIQNHNVEITPTAGGGGYANTGIYYVSKTSGDNGTAEAGNPGKPWADPWAATTAAANGGFISILDGYWTVSADGEGGDLTTSQVDTTTLGVGKSLNYYFPRGSGIGVVDTATSPILLFAVDSAQVVHIYGEGTFKGNDVSGTRMVNVGTEATLYWSADSVEVSPFDGVDDGPWRQNGLHLLAGSHQTVNLEFNNLFTNFDAFFWGAYNVDNAKVNVRVRNHYGQKDDGVWHIGRFNRIDSSAYRIHTEQYHGYNTEWYVYGTYRTTFLNSTVSCTVDNIISEGPPSNYNMYFTFLEGELFQSSAYFKVGSGRGPMKIMRGGTWNRQNTTGTQIDSISGFGSVTLEVGSYTWTGGPTSQSAIDWFGSDSTNFTLNVNMLSLDTLLTPVRLYKGIDGSVRVSGIIQSPDGVAPLYINDNDIILDGLTLKTNGVHPITVPAGGRTIQVTDARYIGTIADPVNPITYIGTPSLLEDYGTAPTASDIRTTNTYFLSQQYGDDATGVKTDRALPFLTIDSTGYTSSDDLDLLDGSFTFPQGSTAPRRILLKSNGVAGVGRASGQIGMDVGDVPFSITGDGELDLSGTGTAIRAPSRSTWNWDFEKLRFVNSGVDVAQVIIPAGGEYRIKIDSLYVDGADDVFYISDFTAPYAADLNESFYDIDIGTIRAVKGNRSNRIIWFYGPRNNTADIVEDTYLNVNADNYTYTLSGSTVYDYYTFMMGSNWTTRGNYKNGFFRFRIGNVQNLDEFTTRPSPNMRDTYVRWSNTLTQPFWIAFGSCEGCDIQYEIDAVQDTSLSGLFVLNRDGDYRKSRINIEIGYANVLRNVYEILGDLQDTTVMNVRTGNVKSREDGNCVAVISNITNNSVLRFDGGVYSSLSDTLPTFAFESAPDATSKIVFHNVTINSNAPYSIGSAVPIDVYVEGNFYANKPVHPNINLIYEQTAPGTSSFDIGEVWYVSSTEGDNATAVKGDPSRPFSSLYVARDSAVAGDRIVVQPGQYNIGSGTNFEVPGDANYDLGKDSVTWYFESGANVFYNPPGNLALFGADSSETVKVLGHLTTTGTGDYFMVLADDGDLTFEFDEITNRGYTFLIYNQSNFKISGNKYTSTERPLMRLAGFTNATGIIDVDDVIVNNASTSFNFGVIQFEDYFGSVGLTGDDTLFVNNANFTFNARRVKSNTALCDGLIQSLYVDIFNSKYVFNVDNFEGQNFSVYPVEERSILLDTRLNTDIGGTTNTFGPGDYRFENSSLTFNVKNLSASTGQLLSGGVFNTTQLLGLDLINSSVVFNCENCYVPMLAKGGSIKPDNKSQVLFQGNYQLSGANATELTEVSDFTLTGTFRGPGTLATLVDTTSLKLRNAYAEFVTDPPVTLNSGSEFKISNTTLVPMMPEYASNDLVYIVTKLTEETRLDSLIAPDSTMFLTLPAGTYELVLDLQFAASTSRDFEAGLTADYPGNWRLEGGTTASGWEAFGQGTGLDSGDPVGGETPVFLVMRGTIELATETTIYLQWGEQNTGAVGFSTLFPNSFMKATRIE